MLWVPQEAIIVCSYLEIQTFRILDFWVAIMTLVGVILIVQPEEPFNKTAASSLQTDDRDAIAQLAGGAFGLLGAVGGTVSHVVDGSILDDEADLKLDRSP